MAGKKNKKQFLKHSLKGNLNKLGKISENKLRKKVQAFIK